MMTAADALPPTEPSPPMPAPKVRATTAPALEATELDCFHGRSHVLRAVDFHVAAGETVSLKIRGLAGVPKKKKKATAVILKVTTKGKDGADGRVGFFPTGGADPGTRSAPIMNGRAFSSFVVSDISTTGEISFTASATS